MLSKLVERALSMRLAVLGLALGLAGLGAWAFMRLPIDAFPDISSTQVKIILKAPGMTPEEVESRVITPIEMEMLGIPKQTNLRSMGKYAIADITIDFADGTDIYWARSQVAERLNGVMADLPATVSGGMAPISTPLSDMYMFTLEGPQSLAEKRRTLDWVIRPALRTVPGVADVNALGGLVETFEVVPDTTALAGANLSVSDLQAAIEASNRNDGAGRLVAGEEALIVRATGAIRTLDDLSAVVVRSDGSRVVRVGDVARVTSGSLTRYGAVTRDGKGETVEGLVIGLRGADAAQVVAGVKQRLAELQPSMPAGMTVSVFYDRSNLIERAVGTVEEALIEATLLVVVLLLLFLGDVRASVIVALALPMAALLTFIFMRSIGLTANLMSLGGLAIAVGMLVDGAVVVVENVVERLSDPKHARMSKLHNIFVAASEVAKPVASGMAIIALVFLPLLTLQGLEGKLFAPVALTIVLALLSALVLSLTLVPVMALYVLKLRADGGHHEPWLMRQIGPRYAALLAGAFARKRLVYTVAGISLLVTGAAYSVTGKTFLPTMDEGSVIVQLTKLPSISLEHSVEGDLKVQKALLSQVPEVTEVIARVGSDELGLDPMGLNETDSFLKLKPRDEWRVSDKDWLVEQLRKALADLPGIEPSFTQPIEMRISEMLTGARGDLAIKLFGPDLDELARLAGQIQTRLEAIPGTSEAMTVANDRVDYLQLDIDRVAAGRLGMPVNQLQDAMRAQVEGVHAGVVNDGIRRIPLVIRGEGERLAPQAFADQLYRTPGGQLVRASDVARVERVEGPVKLEHENGSRFALVQAFVSGRDLVGYVEEAKADIGRNVQLPPGYRIVWGGQFENQQRASARLMVVLPISLVMIFIVLYATLSSMRASLLILLNIPFAVVGGMLSLAVSGEYLSVPASVGFIALLGIAVLNGLVMVSYFRQLRESGMPLAEAVRRGAERRLRPVLMTASIAAFGLVPLLFATGPGSEIQKPLAIVVIGGLVSSTLLTLILLPMLYERFGESKAEREAGDLGHPARTPDADDGETANA
ncbi:efflux RND transporter permease subunit [Novosphingobium mangrovi (ex Huang et al. 2023)]|uniref:CusA/CzcA family heavy metal efflux RND transporter n=1 Tax=Novosphingobium mangrovi (ex Huang et al. 2023) TaxID=2976432 RepID=A0ABT2IA37_9SPHN|nr:CusA/CzcA family heavy metal efflux RND transporter [Novosphingobium mangrovi (ex Huang et al. 2023)]MCT2401367.1 CusA/CzcA family heavy metal efflux RND transporter [Novosphingobium mangrovi (ex Huang et al. 2023)]